MPRERIAYFSAEDNWWAADSLVHVVLTQKYFIGSEKVNRKGIKGHTQNNGWKSWNNVFMQFKAIMHPNEVQGFKRRAG